MKRGKEYINSFLNETIDSNLLKAMVEGLYPKDKQILVFAFGPNLDQKIKLRGEFGYSNYNNFLIAIKRINDNLEFCKEINKKEHDYTQVTISLAKKLNTKYILPRTVKKILYLERMYLLKNIIFSQKKIALIELIKS